MRWLLLTLMLVPVTAATDPTPDNPTLWMHAASGDLCCTEWMNTVQDDPDQDLDGEYYAVLTPANPVPRPDAAPAWDDGVAYFTMPMDPALVAPLDLDPAGSIDAVAYLVSSGPQGVGVAEATAFTRLLQDDVVVADGGNRSVSFANEPVEVRWSFPVNQTRLDPADGNLVWQIGIHGVGLFVGISMVEGNWTHLTLPFATDPPAPGVFYHDHAGGLRQSFSTATTATHHHNITGPADAVATLSADVVEGSASLVLRDADGAKVLERTLTADKEETRELSGRAGTWTASVTYTDFAGTVELELAERQAPPPETSTTPPPETSTPVETTAEPQDDAPSQDSPGFGLLVAVAAVALALRRK